MLSGDNSILQKATDAKEYSERAEIVENAKLDILAKISEKKGENLTASELEEILISSNYKTQGTLSDEENILERTLTSKDGKYEIPVLEIYNGNLKTSQSAIITPKTISFTIDNPGIGDQITYTAIEGQTWYEWAVATKDDESSSYYSYYLYKSLQEQIIEFYNQDPNREIGWGSGNEYWELHDENATRVHVNDVIVEYGDYGESWSEEV